MAAFYPAFVSAPLATFPQRRGADKLRREDPVPMDLTDDRVEKKRSSVYYIPPSSKRLRPTHHFGGVRIGEASNPGPHTQPQRGQRKQTRRQRAAPHQTRTRSRLDARAPPYISKTEVSPNAYNSRCRTVAREPISSGADSVPAQTPFGFGPGIAPPIQHVTPMLSPWDHPFNDLPDFSSREPFCPRTYQPCFATPCERNQHYHKKQKTGAQRRLHEKRQDRVRGSGQPAEYCLCQEADCTAPHYHEASLGSPSELVPPPLGRSQGSYTQCGTTFFVQSRPHMPSPIDHYDPPEPEREPEVRFADYVPQHEVRFTDHASTPFPNEEKSSGPPPTRPQSETKISKSTSSLLTTRSTPAPLTTGTIADPPRVEPPAKESKVTEKPEPPLPKEKQPLRGIKPTTPPKCEPPTWGPYPMPKSVLKNTGHFIGPLEKEVTFAPQPLLLHKAKVEKPLTAKPTLSDKPSTIAVPIFYRGAPQHQTRHRWRRFHDRRGADVFRRLCMEYQQQLPEIEQHYFGAKIEGLINTSRSSFYLGPFNLFVDNAATDGVVNLAAQLWDNFQSGQMIYHDLLCMLRVDHQLYPARSFSRDGKFVETVTALTKRVVNQLRTDNPKRWEDGGILTNTESYFIQSKALMDALVSARMPTGVDRPLNE